MARSLGDAYVRVRPDTRTFPSETARGVERAGNPVVSRMGSIAKRAGIALGTAGLLGAVAFTANAVKLEAEFGRTMNVLAATTGAPKAAMRDLNDLALKMGADTVFSANDASKAMLELARGGMTAATIQGGALKGTLTLAAAGQLEMGEAANTAVKAMGQFNLKGKDMGDIAAALAGGANASSASVSDMSQALAQGGLAADSVGFSIQETTGILAAFSNKGLEGSDAGTSLKTALDRLVPSTKTASDAMKNVGLITEDGRNKFLKLNGEYKSAAQVAAVLKRATDDLSSSERKKTLSAVFGSDAQRAATILSKEGAAGIKEMVKATSDQDAAQRMAQANMKGTAGAIERMKGSVETASLAWGQAIKPITTFGANVIAEVANGATPIIQDFGKHMRGLLKGVDLSGDIKKMFGSIDVGATFDKIGDAVGKLGGSMKRVDWSGAKEAFGKGTSDTISVFGVAIGFAADHVDELARFLPALIAGFIAYKAIQATSNAVALASLPIETARVAALFASAGANRALAAQMAITNGAEQVGLVTRIRSTAATIASTVASKVARGATLAWAGVQWLLNAALTANPIGLVVVAIAALVGGLILAYKKSETFRNIVNGAFNGVKKVASAVFGKIVDVVSGAFNWIKNNWKNILAILTGPIGIAVRLITANWDTIKAGAAAVKDFVAGKFGDLVNFFQGIPGKIKGAFSNAGDLLKSIGGNIVDGLRNGISAAWHKVTEVVENLIGLIPKKIREIMGIASPSKVTHKLGEDIGQGLADGLKKKLDDAEQVIRDHLGRVNDQLSTLKSTAGDFASTVAGNFQGDLFAGGLAEFRAQLKTDKANAEFFTAALKEVQKKGLSGKLFQEVAASGNLQIAQEFTHLSRADIGRQEKLFASRNKAAAGAGQFAASTTFGSDIKDTTKELRGLRADLRQFLREKREIVVNDRSGHPRQTAREVARLTAFAGGS